MLFECHSLYHMEIAIIVIINTSYSIHYVLLAVLLAGNTVIQFRICVTYNIMHATIELK